MDKKIRQTNEMSNYVEQINFLVNDITKKLQQENKTLHNVIDLLMQLKPFDDGFMWDKYFMKGNERDFDKGKCTKCNRTSWFTTAHSISCPVEMLRAALTELGYKPNE